MSETFAISAHAIGMMKFCPRLGMVLRQRNESIPISQLARMEHFAVIDFHKEWIHKLSELAIYNIGRLEYILRVARKEIYKTYPKLTSSEGLKVVFDQISKDILETAKKTMKKSDLDTRMLIREYFGGFPEFNKTITNDGIFASPDIIAIDSNHATVWKYVPEDGLLLDDDSVLKNAFAFETATSALTVEREKEIPCKGRLIMQGVTRHISLSSGLIAEIDRLTEALKMNRSISSFPAEKCNSCKFHGTICSSSLVDDDKPVSCMPEIYDIHENQTNTVVPVGRILQNVSKALNIRTDKKRLFGYLHPEHASKVQPGDLLTAVSRIKDSNRLICRVVEAKSSRWSQSIIVKSIEGFVCNIEIEPMGINRNGSFEEVPSADFDGYDLIPPSKEDISVIFGLPTHGIPMGFLAISKNAETRLDYLYDPNQAFKSMFICGGQGTGKTNFIRYLIEMFQESKELQPAIVVLDVEGQFTHLRINSATYQVLRVSTHEVPGDTTLSFSALGPRYIPYFVPELTTKTIDQLDRIANEVCYAFAKRGENLSIHQLLREIESKANRDMRLPPALKGAVMRATLSPTFNMFDQPGTPILDPQLLLEPGKITIIDASELTEDEQRVAAIYLMATLFEKKRKNYLDGQADADLLLVIDEAHRLFPQRGDMKKDYVTRIAKFVKEITHRGRKRKYGVILATQSPTDLSSEISGLCETKVFFRVAGHQIWLKEQIGDKETIKAIGDLPNFTAYIVIKGGSRQPVALRFPNVSDNC